jgi:PhnB protein
MSKKVKAIPEGYHSVTASIVVREAAKAIEFYKKAFGAEELRRFPGPFGSIMHAELRIGDSIVMLTDEMPDMGAKSPVTFGGSPVSFYVYVPHVDTAWKRALDAGAKAVMPLADMFWGDRAGRLQDPYGHVWMLAQHTTDLTPEQIDQAREAFTAQMHGKKH